MGLEVEHESDTSPFTKGGLVKLGKTLKMVIYGAVAMGIMMVILGALVIWLGVTAMENHDDIKDLNRKLGPVAGEEGKVIRLATTAARSDSFNLVSPVFQGTGYWTIRGNLPFKRSDHEAATIGDVIYVVGGNDANGSATTDISIYDPVLGTFTEGPEIPNPLTRFAMVHVPGRRGGKLYLIGGLEDGDGDSTGEVHILDIRSGKWSKGPSLKTPRSDFCGAHIDGKIYVAGGYPVGYTSTLDSVEVLDLDGNEWEEGVPLPTPRGDCKCGQLDGKFVVIGGFYDPNNEWASNSFREEVEAFDTASQSWRSLAPLPNARGDKAVVSLPNNRLLVVGGESHHRGERTEVATHHVEEYLGDHDIWVHKVPLPLPRFRTSASYADGTVYLFGGHAICLAGEDSSSSDCPETEEIQAFHDLDHPDVFLLEED